MTQRSDGRSDNRSSTSRVAHVIERAGLAIAGALCGLFVAALLAKADIGVLSPVDLALAMILYGVIGFYVGIDIPKCPSSPSWGELSNIRFGPNVDLAELLSAVGVFLSTATALVSVYVVVFDDVLPAIGVVVVGSLWLLGVAMQIVAGVIARIRKHDYGLG
jgi:hypothetical protein